jgi:RNA polymerase sigma-70 factor (ECF subfamily)
LVVEPEVVISEDEEAAVSRCQAGEREAYGLIVERYGGLLYGTAYLMLRDRGQAEDATQEAFLAAWRSIRTFSAGRSLRPWLLRILVNQVRQSRRRKLLPLVPWPQTHGPAANSATEPEQAAEKGWERHEVRQALSALPGDSARIVVLRFFAELSVPEIGDVLGVPEGTVKSRLHRALRKLEGELTRRHVVETSERLGNTRQERRANQ